MNRTALRVLAIAVALFCATITHARSAPLAAITGTFSIQPASKASDVSLEIRWMHDSQQAGEKTVSSDVAVDRLGLTQDAISGPSTTRTFAITAESGKIVFTGAIGEGVGAGDFTFAPSADFAARLKQRNIALLDSQRLLEAAFFNITMKYVEAMAVAGYPTEDFRKFVAFHEVGVTPALARALQAVVGPVDARHLISLTALGVTPSYASELRSLGVSGLDAQGLVQMKSAGIDAEYVRSIATEGYARLARREILHFKALGITASYLRDLAAAGYPTLSAREVVQLKAADVDKSFIDNVRAHGVRNPTVREILQIKNEVGI